MKALRILILTFSGALSILTFVMLFRIIATFHHPPKHHHLQLGIWFELTAWGTCLLLPLTIGLSELWFSGSWKRWVPHVLFIIGSGAWAFSTIGDQHPYIAALFASSLGASILIRLFADRLWSTGGANGLKEGHGG